MSISFSMSEGRSTLEEIREARLSANGTGEAKRATSAPRVEANRRNAQRSTGPRTTEGKQKSSRNALKHGLCRTLACLPSECEATFMTFVGELEQELRPATPLQRIAFNQIASLTWRLQRLPEAQTRIFEQELGKVEPDEHDERREDGTVQLKPSDVLARRFSDDPASNGFALLERYERGLRSQLLRLMKHYDQLQKHRGTVPYDKDEPPCPDEGKQPAWTEEKARAQRAWCAEQERRERAGETTDAEWNTLQENLRKAREQNEVATPASLPALPGPIDEATQASQLRGETKRTQSKPSENLGFDPLDGKCATSTHAPLTKRTHSQGVMLLLFLLGLLAAHPRIPGCITAGSSVSCNGMSADAHANHRPPMTIEALRERVNEGEVDTVLMVFPDTNGRLVGKRLTANYFLEHCMDAGTHGCNYLLTVNMEMDPLDGFDLASWDRGFGDFAMKPDLSTLRLLPWQKSAAMVLCDVQYDDGKLVAEAPRSVLRKQLDRLSSQHLTCNIASELEFFLFNQTYHQAYDANYANLLPSSDYRIDYHTMQTTRDEPILHAIRQHMGEAGVPIESTKGEWGKGQHEVNFVYSTALPMADGHMVFKQGAKEIADQHGKCLSFMPKITATEAGNSCHIHISVWKDGASLFWDSKSNQPSKYFRQFLGGQMKYSRELCYFFAPTVNAYKRFQPGSWAPTRMAWAMDNRTTGFRVVGYGKSFRIENRMPGGDANPYLSFAAMIAAGLAGVEEGLDCGEPYKGNAYIDPKLTALPTTLKGAADLLDRSELAHKAFGDDVVKFYVHTARQEVKAFDAAVTDWERMRYFERI